MQSKLPVRVKKKSTYADKKQCNCAQLLKILMENHIDSVCVCKTQKAVNSKQVHSTTQTKNCDLCNGSDRIACLEIKKLLESINSTLEHILVILQDKKEYLYDKLQEEASNNRIKIYYNKNKTDKSTKSLQLDKKFTYTWPEISRLYYGQPLWLKHYMQKFVVASNSNIVIYPRRSNWTTARPLSCSDINYFQPMGRILGRQSFGISIYPNPIFTLLGQGDLNVRDEDEFEHPDSQKCTRKVYAPKIDKEIQ